VACAEAGNFADAIRCANKALEIGFEDAADKEKAGQHLAVVPGRQAVPRELSRFPVEIR